MNLYLRSVYSFLFAAMNQEATSKFHEDTMNIILLFYEHYIYKEEASSTHTKKNTSSQKLFNIGLNLISNPLPSLTTENEEV